jgi:thiol-disulfide isomerase/thioredoxin
MLARSVLHHCLPVFRARALSNYVVLGDEQKLKEILAAEGSKILYFTATWCPPCRKIAPMFEKMSKEFADTVFVKIGALPYPTLPYPSSCSLHMILRTIFPSLGMEK